MAASDYRVFVSNLASTVTEESLKAFFKKQGFETRKVILPKDRETGKMRGFGFVDLLSDIEVLKATQNLPGLPLEGRDIRIDKARESEKDKKPGPEGTELVRRDFPVKKIYTCPHCGGQIEIIKKRKEWNNNNKKVNWTNSKKPITDNRNQKPGA